MNVKTILSTLLLVAALADSAFAIEVDQVVSKANHAAYYQGQDGRAKVQMIIKDSQGRERKREFVILRRDQSEGEGDQQFYVYFRRPADVNKMVFMVSKHVNKDDDRWLYLPALDLVRRIAAGDKRTSFVGSNFFYEDVSGRNPKEDTHELVEETDTFYVLKSTPKDTKNVEFSYYKNWIHKASFLPIKTEFFNDKNEVYRVYEALRVDQIDGFQTVTQARMRDLQTGAETSMSYSDVKYNLDLPEDIFSERYLRNPPLKYLR